MSLALTGLGASSGIAIGRVHRLMAGELALPEYHLDARAIDAELERLQRAVDRGHRFLGRLLERLADSGDSARELLEAHRLILKDPLLIDGTASRIREQQINAEWALMLQSEQLLAEFRRMDDEYLALRREDLEQVVQLIQRELAEQPASLVGSQVPHQLDQTVIVAKELGPADMAILHQRKVAGLVSEHGGPLSHSAILARGLEIPMVVGIHHALEILQEEEAVILDGHYGALLLSDDENLLRHYHDKQEGVRLRRADLKRYLSRPSRTVDGTEFRLFGNAELPDEFERCQQAGAVGVGLMRTEYLFLGDRLPDEDSQFRAYRAAVRIMDGKPVTFRTLDIGGDKLPAALSLAQGPNPALGLRGLRLSLAVTELFREQIRAMLRASVEGPVQILLPMLTSPVEIRQARAIIDQCRLELTGRGVAVDPGVALGGMIETPAAALDVDRLAAELDFLSIGTNDLIQYVLAIDRQDELVSYLYDPAHPGLLELIERIVEAGRRHSCPVTVCGELAADEKAARMLLGLGVTQFSLPPANLLSVKKSLIEAHASQTRRLIKSFREGHMPGASGQDLLNALTVPRP